MSPVQWRKRRKDQQEHQEPNSEREHGWENYTLWRQDTGYQHKGAADAGGLTVIAIQTIANVSKWIITSCQLSYQRYTGTGLGKWAETHTEPHSKAQDTPGRGTLADK